MAPCSRCRSPAVTFIRYSGQHLCPEHFVRFVEKRAKMEVAKQGRLPEGTLAVALSGGKDSVALLHFLAKLTRDHPRTDLVAISVDEGIAGYRDGALRICEKMTRDLGVPWHVVRTEDLAGYTIDAYAAGEAGPSGDAAKALRVEDPVPGGAPDATREASASGQGPAGLGRSEGPATAPTSPREASASGQGASRLGLAEGSAPPTPRPACGPCGVFRRLGLNDTARKLGAAALATGHNLDDQAQTVLMNVLQGDVGRMARLAPHDREQPGLVPRILPFRTIPEKEILLYAMLEGLPVHDEAECPYAARANRFAMRDILLGLEADQPGTRHRLLRFHEGVRPLVARDVRDIGSCTRCGEPTSSRVCRACLWADPRRGRG